MNVDVSRLTWRKSSRSQVDNCVEVAGTLPGVAVRDSKDRGDSMLLFTPREWNGFLAGVRRGELDQR